MNNALRSLVDLRDRMLQKSRVAFNNRIKAIERGSDTDDSQNIELLERWHRRFDELENEADKDIVALAKQEPIIQIMTSVKGVGFLNAAKVVALISIEDTPSISALWRYAGFGVIDGKRERLVKGQKASFNKRLKTACYLVGLRFIQSRSPYRDVYDNARARYDIERPDWTDGHKHNAAMGKMVKLWLSHLWTVWRDHESLPVSQPYIVVTDPKHHYITPEEMGWDLSHN